MTLYPLTLERSSQLAQLEFEEKYALECAHTAFEEEREKVEQEWKKGHDKVRERLMESIEERRRKARDDKEGEGTVAGASSLSSILFFPTHPSQTALSTLNPVPTLLGSSETN